MIFMLIDLDLYVYFELIVKLKMHLETNYWIYMLTEEGRNLP